MTNSTIIDTVHEAMEAKGYGQYLGYANEVIEALEDREQSIADAIRDAAEAAGYGNQADAILAEVGLPDRQVVEPEPALYDTGNVTTGGVDMASLNDALERALRPIRDQVERLTTAARSRGISV